MPVTTVIDLRRAVKPCTAIQQPLLLLLLLLLLPGLDAAVSGPGRNGTSSTVTQICDHRSMVADDSNGTVDTEGHGKFIKFAILLPEKPSKARDVRILSTVLPVIEMATKVVTDPGGLLAGFRIEIDHRDTRCSSTYGGLGAFDMFLKRKPDIFFGPICDYVIAPIARYGAVWGIPLITSGGLTEAFSLKQNGYSTLTRLMGNYHEFGAMMRDIHIHYQWTAGSAAYLYHEWDEKLGRGFTDCSMAINSINRAIGGNQTTSDTFDEETAKYADYLRLLRRIEKRARIVIMCASPATIREIMLAAAELNMVSSGEYVFFNIEIFGRYGPEHNFIFFARLLV
uniref:Putative atrial natriuretic peptide receptor n=1 Tax=Anopheles triannulatus TaxID=58253 RepID=A0A2M4A8A9_9DIPT